MSIVERETSRPVARRRRIAVLTQKFGLRVGRRDELSIRRLKHGKGYRFVDLGGRTIRDIATLARLKSLAVPPAYIEVRYAIKPDAHLQAVGRDAAGRLQYRYHSDWEKVRELRKARRLMRLVAALPKLRRSVAQRLSAREPTREFALSAVIELVARTAIRPGNESYARLHGSRGATTLLKSNVTIEDDCIVLSFRAKGGKAVQKECDSQNLVRAIELLQSLPGRRLFQYKDEAGKVQFITSAQVNAFLRQISGVRISLKDFRTLMASAAVMESLARVTPAGSARGRNRQIMEAVKASAQELANTPTICRKSYVHESVVTAFEAGVLERFSFQLRRCRSPVAREQVLLKVMALGAESR